MGISVYNEKHSRSGGGLLRVLQSVARGHRESGGASVLQVGGVAGMCHEQHVNEQTAQALSEIQEMKAHPDRYPGYDNAREMIRDILS